jgi:opine dehydrogenase
MVPWHELILKCNLVSSTIRELIQIASVVIGLDYLQHGRTLNAAGICVTGGGVVIALGLWRTFREDC